MIEGGFLMLVCGIMLSIASPIERALRRHHHADQPSADLPIAEQLRDAFSRAADRPDLDQLVRDAEQALTHAAR